MSAKKKEEVRIRRESVKKLMATKSASEIAKLLGTRACTIRLDIKFVGGESPIQRRKRESAQKRATVLELFKTTELNDTEIGKIVKASSAFVGKVRQSLLSDVVVESTPDESIPEESKEAELWRVALFCHARNN